MAPFEPTFAFEALPDRSLAEHLRQAITKSATPHYGRMSNGQSVRQAVESDDDADADPSSQSGDDDDHEDGPAINFTRTFAPGQAENLTASGRVRIADGRAAITKKVTVDLDSDDDIIKTMKDAGHSNEAVQKKLVDEGRIKYVVKSIATRYGRIQRAFHKAETENLDEDLTDWHEGDDEVLEQARTKNLEDYKRALESVENKYWMAVAEDVHNEQKTQGGNARFSKHACRSRFQSIQDGNAEPVFEQDPDQEGRIARREARMVQIAAYKAKKQEEAERAAEEKARRDAEKAEYAEAQLLKHLSREDEVAFRAAKAIERREAAVRRRDEKERNRFLREAKQARTRKQKEEAAEKKKSDKLQRAWALADRRRELKLKQMAKQDRLKQMQLEAKMQKDKVKQGDRVIESRIADIVRISMREALSTQIEVAPRQGPTPKRPRPQPSAAAVAAKRGRPKKYIIVDEDGVEVDKMGDPIHLFEDESQDDEELPALVKKERPAVKTPPSALKRKGMTLDPRANLDRDELRKIARKRKISCDGGSTMLRERIKEADLSLTFDVVQSMLDKRGVDSSGTLSQLIFRLAADDAAKYLDESPTSEKVSQSPESSSKRMHPTDSPANGDSPGSGSRLETSPKKKVKFTQNNDALAQEVDEAEQEETPEADGSPKKRMRSATPASDAETVILPEKSSAKPSPKKKTKFTEGSSAKAIGSQMPMRPSPKKVKFADVDDAATGEDADGEVVVVSDDSNDDDVF